MAPRHEQLADASCAWFDRTLAMRSREGGFAGFRAYVPDGAGTLRWSSSPAYLSGAGGVALALAGALSPALMVPWDEPLLLP